MIWSSIVIFCYLALNLTLSAFGHVVWVPIDFKDWWAALYICVFLGIAGVSVVLPIYVNNWWSKEITSRTQKKVGEIIKKKGYIIESMHEDLSEPSTTSEKEDVIAYAAV